MEKEYSILKRVKSFCRQNELLFSGDRVLLGLSGGADSVCLFLLLAELREELSLTLYPVHVHHGIRGEEADRDARFCERLCAEHGLRCEVYYEDVPALAREKNWTLEEAGRNVRYQIFREHLEKGMCNKIAVAHHKNDQAETVLFQLFRGSRLKGLSGMESKNGAVIRPLLGICREEIEEYLQIKKQEYCIDRTNFEEEYTRNVIRQQILPAAEKLQRGTVEHIVETADYARRVEVFLEMLSDQLYQTAVVQEIGEGTVYRASVSKLLLAEPLLSERVLYRVLCEASGGKKDITSGYVNDCMELLRRQSGKQLSLPRGLVVRKSYDELKFGTINDQKNDFEEVITAYPWEKMLPDGRTMTLSLVKNDENTGIIPKSTYTKWFDYDKIVEIVSLRKLRAEDRIVLYRDGRGKAGLEVLKDARVPREHREDYPILVAGNQILWIPGIRGSEAFRVTEETEQILIAAIDGGLEHGR